MVPNRSELDRNCAGKCSDLDRNFTLPETRWEPTRKVGRGSRATGAWNSLGHRPEPAASSAGTGAELCWNSAGTRSELARNSNGAEHARNSIGTAPERARNLSGTLPGNCSELGRDQREVPRTSLGAQSGPARKSSGTRSELTPNSHGTRPGLGARSGIAQNDPPSSAVPQRAPGQPPRRQGGRPLGQVFQEARNRPGTERGHRPGLGN